ncbi:MAG: collagen-like protein [Lachnospiraceae bacterium]|jgi:hypothetical protein|nr:collagen-like protein [Lachnospiraceae bacterium]
MYCLPKRNCMPCYCCESFNGCRGCGYHSRPQECSYEECCGNANDSANDNTGNYPTIGENGNWFIGGVDTGVSAKGEQGETGPAGPPGSQGPSGDPCRCDSLTIPIQKTIDIVDLQSEIDALPKLLMADVKFIINPGTYDGEILIERFSGSGSITIHGANAVGVTTHNIMRLMIFNCSIPGVFISGLTSTATSDLCFDLCYNTGIVEFTYCNAIAGTADAHKFYGICAMNSRLHVRNCKISNKHVAIRVYRADAFVIDADGSNNRVAYVADYAGTIHKITTGSLSGLVIDERTRSGLIIGPNGANV